MASGLGIEVQEMGMVAMLGMLLIPGVVWISKAKTGTAMAERSVLVGVVLVGLAVLEGTLDKASDKLTGGRRRWRPW